MNKVEAVSRVLAAVGRQGVSALDTTGQSEASRAERLIDQMIQDVLEAGWFFNTEFNVELNPDAQGNITLPTGTFVIYRARQASGKLACDAFSQRGQRLYDERNHTYTWTKPVRVTYVSNFDWECIPPPIQLYICRKSAEMYNDQWEPSAAVRQQRKPALMKETEKALREANRYNDRDADVNLVRSQWAARGFRVQTQR